MDTNTMALTIGKGGKWYALFLAILPIVMMYRFPGLDMGLTTVLVAIGVIYAGFVSLRHMKNIDWTPVLLLSMYLIYVAFKSSGVNFLLPIAIIIHVTAISTGAANAIQLRKIIESISVFASFCVIGQQLFHLVAGYHIPMININWVIASVIEDYSDAIMTATDAGNGMYRPCAFFLEPAHFTQVAIYGLGSSLLRELPNFKRALVITFGILASTSGMGFIMTFGFWGWWALFLRNPHKQKKILPNILKLIFVALLIILILMQIPFFSQIIYRFTSDGSNYDTDYNAIDGRLIFWTTIFGNMSISDLIWGFGEGALDEDYYYTGFMRVLYAYGIIGCVFFYTFWLYLLLKSNRYFAPFILIYIALSFLANQTGFISMIFSIGFIMTISKVITYNVSK